MKTLIWIFISINALLLCTLFYVNRAEDIAIAEILEDHKLNDQYFKDQIAKIKLKSDKIQKMRTSIVENELIFSKFDNNIDSAHFAYVKQMEGFVYSSDIYESKLYHRLKTIDPIIMDHRTKKIVSSEYENKLLNQNWWGYIYQDSWLSTYYITVLKQRPILCSEFIPYYFQLNDSTYVHHNKLEFLPKEIRVVRYNSGYDLVDCDMYLDD